MKSPIGKVIGLICALFVLYLAAGILLSPLIHRKAADESDMAVSVGSSAAAPAGSERILCIDDNTDALLWRLRVIESAQDELILSTFSFYDDNSGLDIISALAAAADRNVKVNILVDGIYGFLNLEHSRHFQALISLPNVDARLYNPINLLKPWKLNYRLHDKYLIADDSVYILGGRNIGDLFLGDYQEKVNIDRDVLVCSPGTLPPSDSEPASITELKEYFRSIWELPSNKAFTHHYSREENSEELDALFSHYAELKSRFPSAFRETDWNGETVAANQVTLCAGSNLPENKAPELWKALCGVMSQGKDVLIQSPYVICDKEIYSDLAALTEGGTEVSIITNAVENGANPWGCSDYLNQRGRILNTGAVIYEFAGGQSTHAKTILVDDHISIIGSYNLDIRSSYLDTEMMLVIDCADLNGSLRGQASLMMEQSRQVLPDGSVEKGTMYEPEKMSFGKSCLYAILRALCPLARHLL